MKIFGKTIGGGKGKERGVPGPDKPIQGRSGLTEKVVVEGYIVGPMVGFVLDKEGQSYPLDKILTSESLQPGEPVIREAFIETRTGQQYAINRAGQFLDRRRSLVVGNLQGEGVLKPIEGGRNVLESELVVGEPFLSSTAETTEIERIILVTGEVAEGYPSNVKKSTAPRDFWEGINRGGE